MSLFWAKNTLFLRKNKILKDTHYGGIKGKIPQSVIFNKILSYNIIHITQFKTAFQDNDATNCNVQILMSLADIWMQLLCMAP